MTKWLCGHSGCWEHISRAFAITHMYHMQHLNHAHTCALLACEYHFGVRNRAVNVLFSTNPISITVIDSLLRLTTYRKMTITRDKCTSVRHAWASVVAKFRKSRPHLSPDTYPDWERYYCGKWWRRPQEWKLFKTQRSGILVGALCLNRFENEDLASSFNSMFVRRYFKYYRLYAVEYCCNITPSISGARERLLGHASYQAWTWLGWPSWWWCS